MMLITATSDAIRVSSTWGGSFPGKRHGAQDDHHDLVHAAIENDLFVKEIARLGTTARYLTSVCNGSLILGAAGFL
jgi:putative intracellular protease/amidase